MKKKISLPVLTGVLMLTMATLGCNKQNDQRPVALENTTWKLTKEIWTFSNGNTQTFVKQSDLDGVFIWSFLNNQDVKILYEPYAIEENGQWIKTNDKIIINVRTNDNSNVIRNYKIMELTDSFMKLDFEDQNGESSDNGRASKIYFELIKQ